jgi:uracil-DNA glycosylase family 4
MGVGKKGARVLVIQESPYEAENRKGQYMGGKGGRLFRAALSEVGIDDDDVYYTSLVKCSTPEDRIPAPDECKACLDYLLSEIDIVKPEIIVPTGNLSLKFIAGFTGITKQRGKLTTKDDLKIFPIIHPNMVLKQPKYMDWFTKDMVNLKALLDGEVPPDILLFEKEYVYGETYEDVIIEIRRLMMLPPKTEVTFDLETVKTNPFIEKVTMSDRMREMYPESGIPKIIAVGLSDRPGYGFAFPLYHRQTPFTGNQLGTIVKFLRMLFERTDLVFVGQNVKFDVKWLREWLDIWVENAYWDTMLMHYLTVTEEKGTHNLKDLAWLETDMGGYDDELDKVKPKGDLDEGNYDLIDWDILKVYLCGDVDVTQRLLHKYKPNITNNSQIQWIWDNLMVPGMNTLLDIEFNGVTVDMGYLSQLEQSYPEEIKRLQGKLHEFPEILDIERESASRWEERIGIGQIQKCNRTTEQQVKFEKYKKYDPTKGGQSFNFASVQQLQELMFNRMRLNTVVLTDTGNSSTNDESLIYMQDQHPICSVLLEFRKVNHLNNNFVSTIRSIIDSRGRIHPSYNIHGTVTGRLSSNDPNAQQFPRHVNNPFLFQYWNEIKSLFVSRFGDDGVIVQFDYSQLELRILAIFSQDPTLIELYRSGADLHKAVASDAFNVPVEEVTKDQRTASKKIQFGIVYQESAPGLSEDLRAEGINMSVAECERFITKYFKRFPSVKKWVEETKRFAKRHKYVETKTGRVRHLPAIDSSDRSVASEATRQAVNAPIQSTGSDCTLQALIQINKWLKDTGKRSKIVITVHDSIVLDCTKDEVIEVSAKAKHIMEHLAEYNEFYKFIGDVPIVSEMEIGYDYGHAFECTIEDLEEVGVDNFIHSKIREQRDKEQKAFKQYEEEGKPIPKYVEGYWSVETV